MSVDNNNFVNTPAMIKVLLILIVIILFPILIIIGTLYYSWGLLLSFAIWIIWGLRGHNILFVYSDSPIWTNYIQEKILPHINRKAVILNWSERKQWKPSLAVLAFKYFAGRQNFNPMAIVFRPFRLNKEFRFYKAFKEFKHGKTENLEKMRANLLQIL